MRWFTDEAYEDDDFDWDGMLAQYEAHIATIRPLLPPDLAALATEPHLQLHDAEFREVRVNLGAREVSMVLEVGDREITLHFLDAAVVGGDLRALAYAVGTHYRSDGWGRTLTSIMSTEIELHGHGRFLLRLRLRPFHEFAIEFASLSVTWTTRPPEPSKPRPGRFVLIPET